MNAQPDTLGNRGSCESETRDKLLIISSTEQEALQAIIKLSLL